VTVTGRSSEEITAYLNEHVRTHRTAELDRNDIIDTVVIDIDGIEDDPRAGRRSSRQVVAP
jgi:hypothetical protein